MGLIVQKFGGTSVADTRKNPAAARKAIRAQQDGHQVVMVVSAMGKNTDQLVELARQINEKPPAREMDMLLSTGEQVSVALMAMAIDALGQPRRQFDRRSDRHQDRRHPHQGPDSHRFPRERMRQLLEEGNIVIAAGFQGIDEDVQHHHARSRRSPTRRPSRWPPCWGPTPARSTPTSTASTRPIRDDCPRRGACRRISYDEMLELASLGAGVMHSRSIEFAKKFNVPIHVRNSFSDIPGTLICRRPGVLIPTGLRCNADQRRSPNQRLQRARQAGNQSGDLFRRSAAQRHD